MTADRLILVRSAATGATRRAAFPADEPRVQLDHVLSHGDGLPDVKEVRSLRMELSDHRALVVDLA